MDTASIPIPGAQRLRPLQPMVDADGSCSRVFDLERAAEVEVPQELRLHLAAALENGDFDEALLSWLVSEGLITSEGRQSVPAEEGAPREGVPPRGPCRLDGELHVRLELRDDDGLAPALDLAFADGRGGGRVVLHLGCGGAFPSPSTLERVVVEAEQRAYETGLRVLYELALAPRAVTAGIVRYVAGTPLHLRLACEAPVAGRPGGAAWAAAEKATALVLERIPDRLTFHAVLGPSGRLRDVHGWARAQPLLHLDVLLLGAHPDGLPAAAVERYRADLLAAAEEFAADLGHDTPPLDVQPLTWLARRLLRDAAGERDQYPPRASQPVRPARRGVRAITAPAGVLVAFGRLAPAADAAAGAARAVEAEAALHLARRLAGPQAGFALRVLDELARAPLDPFAETGFPGQPLSVC